jgi:outer membrane autotransporter protein
METSFSGLTRRVVVTDGTDSELVSGVSPSPVAALAGVGVTADVTAALDVFITYHGQFSANQTNNAFTAGLEMRF